MCCRIVASGNNVGNSFGFVGSLVIVDSLGFEILKKMKYLDLNYVFWICIFG